MAPFARLRDVVPSAYLRVFQPLDAFDRQEQLHWERYLVEGARSTSFRLKYADHVTTGRLGIMAPSDGEHAEIRVIDGRTYVSPWRMRLRVLGALLSFAGSEPLELSDNYVTRQDAKRAAKELARFRRRDPRAVAFVHQSPWHVPIRWFVLFDDGDRWLGEDELGRTRLRYHTTARRAIRRAERAVPVLRRTDLGPISELILDLHQWLTVFDPGSLLELDYATLCDFMGWDELDDDRSSREIHDALDALEREEYPRSADIYQGVLTRWAEVRSREIMN